MTASKDQPNHGPLIKSAYKFNEMTVKIVDDMGASNLKK